MNNEKTVLFGARASVFSLPLFYSIISNTHHPKINLHHSKLILGNDPPVGNLYKEYTRITKGCLLSESNDEAQISPNKENLLNIEKEQDYEQEIQQLQDQLRASRSADNHFAEEMNQLRAQLEASRGIDQIRANELAQMRDLLAEKNEQNQVIQARINFLESKLIQSRQAHSKTATHALKFALHNSVLHQKLQKQDLYLESINKTYQEEIKNLKHEVKSLCKDLSEAWINVSKANDKHDADSELNESLRKQITRLSIIAGLATRSSRIYSEKVLRLEDDLDEKTTYIQSFTNKVESSSRSVEFSLVHSKSTEFSQSSDINTYKTQNHFSSSTVDTTELSALRTTIEKLQAENRILHENFTDLETSMLKGSFNPKSAIKRLQNIGSLGRNSKRNSKDLDKEKEVKTPTSSKFPSSLRGLRSIS